VTSRTALMHGYGGSGELRPVVVREDECPFCAFVMQYCIRDLRPEESMFVCEGALIRRVERLAQGLLCEAVSHEQVAAHFEGRGRGSA
jgi:hypothetical protein